MKKLKKSVKVILVSVISAVCVLGIILGCYFIFRDNTPPDTTDYDALFSSFATGIDTNYSVSEENYSLVNNIYYSQINNSLTYSDIATYGDNYFISREGEDENGDAIEQFYSYYVSPNSTLSYCKITDYVSNGGFVKDGATSFSIVDYNDNYVILKCKMSDELIDELYYPMYYSLIYYNTDKPVEVFSFEISNEYGALWSLTKIDSEGNQSDSSFVLMDNYFVYAYVHTLSDDKTSALIDVVYAKLSNDETLIKDSDLVKYEDFIFADYSLLSLTAYDIGFTFQAEDEFYLVKVNSDSNEDISVKIENAYIEQEVVPTYSIFQMTNTKFLLETRVPVSSITNSSTINNDGQYYDNYYRVYEFCENEISYVDVSLSSGYGSATSTKFSENSEFYYLCEQKVSGNELVGEYLNIYLTSELKNFISYSSTSSNSIVLKAQDNKILTESGLYKYEKGTLETIKDFSTIESFSLFSNNDYSRDAFVYTVYTDYYGIIDFNGEIKVEGTNDTSNGYYEYIYHTDNGFIGYYINSEGVYEYKNISISGEVEGDYENFYDDKDYTLSFVAKNTGLVFVKENDKLSLVSTNGDVIIETIEKYQFLPKTSSMALLGIFEENATEPSILLRINVYGNYYFIPVEEQNNNSSINDVNAYSSEVTPYYSDSANVYITNTSTKIGSLYSYDSKNATIFNPDGHNWYITLTMVAGYYVSSLTISANFWNSYDITFTSSRNSTGGIASFSTDRYSYTVSVSGYVVTYKVYQNDASYVGGLEINSDNYYTSSYGKLLYSKYYYTKLSSDSSYSDYGTLYAEYGASWTHYSPSKTGYSWSGWSRGSSCSDNGNKYYYGIWSATSYTVAFSANRPSASSDTVSISSNLTITYDNGFTVSNPSLKGYTFSGWSISGMTSDTHYYGSSSSSYSTTSSTSISSTTSTWYKNLHSSSGTVTFKANWSVNSYTIYFDKNTPSNASYSVTLSTTSKTLNYNVSYTFPTPTLTGWTCSGWSTSSSSSTVSYNCGSSYKNLVSSNGGSTTLYAVWKANTYTISAKGGSGTLNGHSGGTATFDTQYILGTSSSTTNLKRSGYYFSGWTASNSMPSTTNYTISPSYTTKTDTTSSITVSTTLKNLTTTSGATVTLTASWTPITYTLSFNVNKPTSSSSTPSVSPTSRTETYDTYSTMPTPTLIGWTCSGWSTSSSGTATYLCGSSYRNFTTTASSTVTLYAIWAQNVYTIEFDTNKPSTATSTPSVSPASITATYEVYYTFPTPTLTGWTCSGWSTSSSGSSSYSCGGSYRNLKTGNGDTITLYAVWEENAYYITYNSNKPSTASGTISGSVSDTLAYYDKSVTLATNSYSLTGWTYLGWSANKSATTATYTSGQTISKPNFTPTSNDTYTLYAIWSANKYTITLSANGGTISNYAVSSNLTLSGSTFTATYDKTGIFTNTIVRAGYMFSGWTISTGTGTANALPANTSYSSLSNYYSSNTETANSINASTTTLNLTATSGGSVTLTAVWTAITYKVSLSSATTSGSTTANLTIPTSSVVSGLTLSNSVYTATYGTTGKFTISTNRTGYIFNGWSSSTSKGTITPSFTAVDDTTTSISVSTEILNLTTVYNSTVTLTEKWSPITYTFVLAGNGGTTTPTGTQTGLTLSSSTYTATFDTTGTFNITALKTGYMFAGFTISTKLGSTSSVPTNTTYSTLTSYYSTYSNTASSINATTTVLNLSTTRSQVVTLTASWTAITYNLVYSYAQPKDTVYSVSSTYTPTGSTPTSQATYDSNSTFSSNGFSLIGWTYVGWSTTSSATAEYSSGATTTTPLNLTTVNGSDVTIYAVWRQNNYTINYNLNNGSKKTYGSYPSEVKFDSWNLVSTPVRTGYTFKQYVISEFTTNNSKYFGTTTSAYSTLGTSVTSYTNSVNSDYYYKNLCSTDGGEVTFEAIWTTNTYQITYDYNNGQQSSSGVYPTTATYDTSFTVSTPERLGYTFTGWYITQMDTACTHYYGSLTTTASYISSTMETSFMNLRATDDNTPVNFKALWRANVYNISYNYDGGQEASGGTYPKTLTYDTWSVISNPTRVGYTFTGWSISGMSTTCLHYYGTSSSSYSSTAATTLSISNISITSFLNLHSEESATVTFKAVWTPNIYKITYVLGTTGGALGTGTFPTSATYDVAVYIDSPTVYPFGYHFDGWSISGMSSDCLHYYSTDGVNYSSVSTTTCDVSSSTIMFMNLHSTTGATVTLTAIWSPNVYKLNYVLTDTKGGNGHFSVDAPTEASYDSQFQVPTPVRTGYTFIGWSLSGLSDSCTHYYSSVNVAFESQNGGYFTADNPNEYVVLNYDIFKNLHCETGAVVTMTANWSANTYTITYHYMPTTFETSTLTTSTINNSKYNTATKTQTVVYDSNFTTFRMSTSDSDTSGVGVPADVKIVYWIFYSSASNSYTLATMDSNGNPIPSHSSYLNLGTEYVFSSYDIWGNYDLFGSDVHAYAIYAFVDINIVIYYADSIINYNYFSNYKAYSTTYTAKTYNDFYLPATVNSRAVLGYWISSNYYIDGEISNGSVTEFELNGVTYTATAGTTIKWGYSSTQASDPENPTFYLYAVYDNSFDTLYETKLVSSSAISIGTAALFESGKTYKITIRGYESTNFYDYSYVKLAKAYNSSSTSASVCAFDYIYSHQDSTSSNLSDFEAVAVNNNTLTITFTADSNCINFNLFIFFDSTEVTLSYLDNVEILISEVVEEI